MIFTSPEFVIFFAVVIPLYFFVPHRFRWILLLVASYFFYAYGNIQYLPLIILSTAVDYIAARMIHNSDQPRVRTLFLVASLVVNLGVLFIFKYFDFFNQSLSVALNAANISYQSRTLNLILPIGISFYTFQSMAYTIDVYRRQIEPERHPGKFATFVAFFPQLVAGPIERAGNLLPQFNISARFDQTRTVEGLRLILWGFFKKIVIADRLAIYVNTVYNDVGVYTGWNLILATVFFAFQIYCDFSAYSDIAIGTAKILGIDLMQNFRQPYFSRSAREFWGRWHISLSGWFRDYVYIPLGGNRVAGGRHLLNLLIVFLLSGLWHGASWTFVIWGALHGLYVVADAFLHQRGLRLWGGNQSLWIQALKIGGTFAFVCFAWIFFRANSFSDALYILNHLFVFGENGSLSDPLSSGLLGAQVEFFLSFGLIGLLLVVDAATARWGFDRLFTVSPVYVRWVIYYALGSAVIFSGLYGLGAQEFIYFQF
jgi:D-alanyl-lipoteichoic acid acyltransferase DltB (MBOAT superfamily)